MKSSGDSYKKYKTKGQFHIQVNTYSQIKYQRFQTLEELLYMHK